MKDEVGEGKLLDPSMPKWKPVPHTRTRRIIEGTAAVAAWMCMGFVFHLSGNAYLLLGIPITIIFQKYVRRAPLRAMWVRDAPPFYLGKMGVAFAILLMIRPLMDLVRCIPLGEKTWPSGNHATHGRLEEKYDGNLSRNQGNGNPSMCGSEPRCPILRLIPWT